MKVELNMFFRQTAFVNGYGKQSEYLLYIKGKSWRQKWMEKGKGAEITLK